MLKIKRRGIVDGLKQMGDEAFHAEDYDEAYERYIEAFELKPALPRSQEHLYQQGLSFLERGVFYSAIKCFNKILDHNESHLDALMSLGQALLYDDHPAQALDCFISGVSKDKGNKEWWRWLAHTYGILGGTDAMIDAYWKILSLDPNDVTVWSYLGRVYCEMRRYQQASNCYQQALVLNADQKDILYALAYIYRKAKVFTSALSYYEKIALLYPAEKSKALYESGNVCFYQLGDYRKAFEYADRAGAIFSNPGDEVLKRNIELLKVRAIAAMKGELPAMQVPTKVAAPQTVVSTYCKLCVLGWGKAKQDPAPEKASPTSHVSPAHTEQQAQEAQVEQGTFMNVTMR